MARHNDREPRQREFDLTGKNRKEEMQENRIMSLKKAGLAVSAGEFVVETTTFHHSKPAGSRGGVQQPSRISPGGGGTATKRDSSRRFHVPGKNGGICSNSRRRAAYIEGRE
ncbi:hypothetical protein AAP_06142 [Ascosphaera apis ARSEF 7405]|uniref:Uncharacterized protein n=1 Tax=Ascosphaera apis ARSEF 7405 TaxID=392613 RepID=A0A167V0W9_9EURO|nr:hypothetical protein AAP_06142 [Ascosphaera apis ARSEF 7405]